jgi:hypothetical protein
LFILSADRRIKLPQPCCFLQIPIFQHLIFTVFTKHGFSLSVLFRDAGQFIGLPDCQALCGISPDFRFNACMSALNMMKWELRRNTQADLNHGCSSASVKIRKFNEYLLKRFCDMSGIDLSPIKSSDVYQQTLNPGAIAA